VTASAPASIGYVHCDFRLVRTSVSLECVTSLLRTAPLEVLRLAAISLRDRAAAKARLAEHARIDVAHLPYDEGAVAELRRRAAAGEQLVLVAGFDASIAERIANHLGVFRGVLASRKGGDLRGGYPQAIATDAAERRATPEHVELPRPQDSSASRLRVWLRVLRVHQWLKNLLLLVPLLTAHRWNDSEALIAVALGIAAFCLASSAMYIANDLLDVAADRLHPRKRLRPFASGALSPWWGVAAIPGLLIVAVGLAAAVNAWLASALAVYVIVTIGYSILLKSYVLIDVLTLAGLYTLRVIAGAFAIEVAITFWLLGFSMFLFLSLALMKRYTELLTLARDSSPGVPGRDYGPGDKPVVLSLGVAAGIAAVVQFSLFVQSDHVATTYARPELLWTLCVTLLYWIGRLWLKTTRGEMHDDPVVYALRDRGSRFVLAVSIAIVLLAEI